MSTLNRTVVVPVLWLGALAQAQAELQVPELVPMQGYLEDATGQPFNGSVSMRFAFYEDREGTVPLGMDSQTFVVEDGVFSVLVGLGGAPLGSAETPNALYVGVAINDGLELMPRFEVGTMPYAFTASNSFMFAGMPPEVFSRDGHHHGWSEITGIPTSIADGDQGLSETEVDAAARAVCYDSPSELHTELDDRYWSSGSAIPWTSLANVPAGFLDGVDDVGIQGGGDAGYVPVFNADGTLGSSTLIQRDGKVETSGDMEVAGRYRYSAPRNYTLILGAPLFMPSNYGMNPVMQTWGDVIRSNGSADAALRLVAPVNLPHGAHLTDLTCYFFDNTAEADFITLAVELFDRDIAAYTDGNSVVGLAEATDAGITGESTLPKELRPITNSSPWVDVNSARALYLQVDWTQTTSDWLLYFSGCSIQYTLDGVP
jgi:hypothetical protein